MKVGGLFSTRRNTRLAGDYLVELVAHSSLYWRTVDADFSPFSYFDVVSSLLSNEAYGNRVNRKIKNLEVGNLRSGNLVLFKYFSCALT